MVFVQGRCDLPFGQLVGKPIRIQLRGAGQAIQLFGFIGAER
ncbi:hypothetical protein [Paenibacillus sacheonensis]|nr:hypothetical protein [Paenibacillus sacheonensis]MBM7563858.1 hypothetical protein [Paenibacillus sacheonensis]